MTLLSTTTTLRCVHCSRRALDLEMAKGHHGRHGDICRKSTAMCYRVPETTFVAIAEPSEPPMPATIKAALAGTVLDARTRLTGVGDPGARGSTIDEGGAFGGRSAGGRPRAGSARKAFQHAAVYGPGAYSPYADPAHIPPSQEHQT